MAMTSSVKYHEDPYIDHVRWEVEIEEREEQMYEDDGKTHQTKIYPADPANGIKKAYKIKLKIKRYFYRKKVSFTQRALVVAAGHGVPNFGGDDAGTMAGNTSQGIPHDSGMRYLCSSEELNLVHSAANVWMWQSEWSGFGRWHEVPANWGIKQETSGEREDVDDEESGGNGGGEGGNGGNGND